MIFCEAVSSKKDALDDLIAFTRQLNAAGVPARVRSAALPTDLGRNAAFDIAPYLADEFDPGTDHLVLLGAQEVNDAAMMALRRIARAAQPRTTAFGTFATLQERIGAKAKLSYALGQDPEIVDLAEIGSPSDARCPDIAVATASIARRSERPRLMFLGLDTTRPGVADAMISLATLAAVDPVIVTSGKGKDAWCKAAGNGIPVYHYGELGPDSLAGLAEIAAVFMTPPRTQRMRALLGNLAARSTLLLDCTSSHEYRATGDAFIASTPHLAFLAQHLKEKVLPNLEAVGAATATSGLVRDRAVPAILTADSVADTSVETRNGHTVFMPTNGVGLGHAQRCSLIASEIDRDRTEPVFAAFGSCMRMLRNYGFDTMPLVSRAGFHAEAHANDMVNYTRLRRLSRGAGAFVFDGGYVFDSIYRTIAEGGMPGAWIRRGLWQDGQDNSIALDREKIFSRVIVPTEAFEELNQRLSRGEHLAPVGPIVQRIELSKARKAKLRKALAKEVGRPFEKLVVTMLGGGVAADRSAQTAAVAAECERHDGILNLVVVWPTATVEPGLFSWENTCVVKTHHASPIVAASDLFVSAVGYNSFHEAIYNRVPTIFVPQMAKFMDDQAARAEAAASRSAATVVTADEIARLNRELVAHLVHGKDGEVRAALAALDLPKPGNSAAARIIEDLAQ